MSDDRASWQRANHEYLAAHLQRLRIVLERHASAPGVEPPPEDEPPRMEHETPAALDTLSELFGLTPFERDVLLLCAGYELDARFAPLCATAQGDQKRGYPTFSLALAALPGAYWAALSPDGALRRWRLIAVESNRDLALGRLRIDERVLHYLAGLWCLDPGLAGLVRPVEAEAEPPPSHQSLAREIASVWAHEQTNELPVVQLTGGEVAAKRDLAVAACALIGHDVFQMPATALPTEPGELERVLRLWQREAALSDSALLLDCDGLEHADEARQAAIARLVETAGGYPLIVSSQERRPLGRRAPVTYDVRKPSGAEQRAIWALALGEDMAVDASQVRRLAEQFKLNGPAIRSICAGVRGRVAAAAGDIPLSQEAIVGLLWDAARAQTRPRMDDLAERIEPGAAWDDLILPDTQRAVLGEIAMHVRQRGQVYDDWGFGGKGQRGLGISALFAGASGTGKTMAAEVLARELRLDLYRIDLSAVVSKYIGETEKNLRRVFDAAEEGGVILLFDEADALFGKRSEVKDSHDRYANVEVAYLLQRMEAYHGLAILTTNMKEALDQAFLRRIRFVVQFPFPDAGQRAEIWRRIFPRATPTDGLDAEKLARLNVAGGNIRNIAMNASFIAADAGQPVRMAHVLRAARSEYAKLEQPLTGGETRGWDETER